MKFILPILLAALLSSCQNAVPGVVSLTAAPEAVTRDLTVTLAGTSPRLVPAGTGLSLQVAVILPHQPPLLRCLEVSSEDVTRAYLVRATAGTDAEVRLTSTPSQGPSARLVTTSLDRFDEPPSLLDVETCGP